MTQATDDARSDALPLVLVHGSGDDARVWDALIARLPDFTCVALDLPGHGALIGSPGPEAMGVAEYAAAVREELGRRGLAGVALAGHSLGSAIALRLAADAPELVRQLALIGGGARLRVLPAFLEGARDDPAASSLRMTELGMAPGHEDQARAWASQRGASSAPGVFARDLAACDAFDMMADLPRIIQPTLIITGEEDRLTPPKYATYLRDHLPNARLALLPNAGHYAMIEAPDALAATLREWLAAVG